MNGLSARGRRAPRMPQVVPGLVLLFAVAHFAHHLVTALPVPLLPFIRDEFALDYTRASLVVSAFSLSYGFSQLPAGWLADRFGARQLVLVGISGVALTGLLVGLSTSYTVLLVALFLMGALGGGYHPAAPAAIASVSDPGRRGRAFGFHMIGGSASYFLAPLAAGGLAALWGWRTPFVVLAIPAIIYGVVLFVVLGRRERLARTVETEGVSHSGPLTRGPEPRINWLRMGTFLTLTSVSGALALSVIAFVPLYLVDVFGVAEHRATMAVALYYSTGLWAAILGGYLSDRIGRVRVVVLAGLLSGPVLAFLGVAGSVFAVMVLLLLLGGAMYARAPASESYVVGHTPGSRRSSVLGLYYFGSMEGSGVLAPVVGYLIDHFGFHTALIVSGLTLCAVAVVCAVVLLRGPGSD